MAALLAQNGTTLHSQLGKPESPLLTHHHKMVSAGTTLCRQPKVELGRQVSDWLGRMKSDNGRLSTTGRARQASEWMGGQSAEQGLPIFTYSANINTLTIKLFRIWSIQ